MLALGAQPLHTGAMPPGHPATTRNLVKSTFLTNGMLLALDGRCMDRLALPLALQLCKRSGKRLDILLVNPPKAATLVLGKFLQQLEEEKIDYRLTSTEGDLADELPLYVHRFRTISLILLDCLDKWEASLHPTLDALRREGYQVLTLLDHATGAPVSNAEWRVAT
jgi:hypothetical protein